ncbi:MAG TPA: tRNA (adenosine(37)-N6)-threonylcarbamoyltransferase complex ATPase subunit type 1 TsaE [Bacteroidetes bacterium]|nr:tRNA (adenosine(37)-N6)-threonylcarbamoyltransferase complex ATPase subunit type 1 TsaE [Bacteroidota bacterium]
MITTLEELAPIADALVHLAEERRILTFSGNLGTGKTTLIQHICARLGVHEDVDSPSFGMVNEYQGEEEQIFHFDLYRLKNAEEALDIGLTEYLDSGSICLIEWPEIAWGLLPEETIHVTLAHENEGKRSISWSES